MGKKATNTGIALWSFIDLPKKETQAFSFRFLEMSKYSNWIDESYGWGNAKNQVLIQTVCIQAMHECTFLFLHIYKNAEREWEGKKNRSLWTSHAIQTITDTTFWE